MKEVERVEANLERVCSRLSKIEEDVTGIRETLAVNTTSLQIHMKRSDTLEKEMKILERTQNKALGFFIACQIIIPVLYKFIL